MHYSIFPTADSWISSGSNKITGVTRTDQNFGQDEILELKKFFYNSSFDHQTRILLNFNGTDFTSISSSVSDGTISSPKYYLKLFEAEGNSDLSSEYTLAAYPVSESWDEGTGKFEDVPKVTDGVSWDNRSNKPGGSAVTWIHNGVSHISGSGTASQSFSYQSPDIEMDVSDIVNNWLDGTNNNNGFLVRFSGSQETDGITHGELKFFSSNTNTIFQPKLEVRWDDHISCTGNNTGSLNQMTSSGLADNDVYMKGLREFYKESDKVKFRLAPRERYIKKTFSTSYTTATGSFIPEKSGSYSIIDVASDHTIVPFSEYTYLSCDSKSNYFIQWLNTFEPDRIYKILYKIKYDDGQEIIYDNDFEFKIKR